MSRIDHTDEARERIQWINEWQEGEGSTPETHLADALVAQAHATLALVEQQRIANRIALATGQHTFEGISRRASDVAHASLVSDPNGDLRPEIAAALGIEVQS